MRSSIPCDAICYAKGAKTIETGYWLQGNISLKTIRIECTRKGNGVTVSYIGSSVQQRTDMQASRQYGDRASIWVKAMNYERAESRKPRARVLKR